MATFIDRQLELRELNALLDRQRAQFVLIYGRRRVGKTTLLLHWAQQSGWPYLYWVARREPAEATRSRLAQAMWRWAYPTGEQPAPQQADWDILFDLLTRMIGDQPTIIIFDEFPFAVEADPALPSHLQALWDQQLKDKKVILVLAGSHISMMTDLLGSAAPLYGRFSARLPVAPLPYAALADFFPRYSAAQRVATYAVVGGIPAYLEQFERGQTPSANIKRHLFQRTGMFRSEPTLLISELAGKTWHQEAILRAIAAGRRTPAEISEGTGLLSGNLGPYLKQIQELGLIERRIPALVPPEQRRTTTRSRYYLRDSYLRFYFRFIEPNLELIEQGLVNQLWKLISAQFRAFIGITAFEDLCREWTLTQARAGQLPFPPEVVGSHWASDVQVDVVAASWREKAVLLGECKWGRETISLPLVRGLVEKASLVVPAKDWRVHYAFFSRAGFSEAARAEAATVGMLLVDHEKLEADLRQALADAPHV